MKVEQQVVLQRKKIHNLKLLKTNFILKILKS